MNENQMLTFDEIYSFPDHR